MLTVASMVCRFNPPKPNYHEKTKAMDTDENKLIRVSNILSIFLQHKKNTVWRNNSDKRKNRILGQKSLNYDNNQKTRYNVVNPQYTSLQTSLLGFLGRPVTKWNIVKFYPKQPHHTLAYITSENLLSRLSCRCSSSRWRLRCFLSWSLCTSDRKMSFKHWS